MSQNNDKNKQRKGEVRLSLRHTTAYSAAILFLLGVTFFGGYFLGKKQMAEQLIMKIDQDSFADQIYSSLCALYDHEEPLVKEVSTESEAAQKAPLVDMVITTTKEEPILEIESKGESTPSFYAELIGYGTRKAAEQFVQKMDTKAVPVKLKERKSTTAKGKQRVWYQVVTELYKNRKNLEILTDRLAREEKIHGIRIVTT